MTQRRLWGLALAPLAVLMACNGRERADQTPPAGAEMAPAAETSVPQTRKIDLQAENGSDAGGQLSLTPLDQRTTIVITLQAKAGNHAANIHEGTCANPGKVVKPLQDLIGSDQSLNSTTIVDMPIDSIMDGNHVVAVHDLASSPKKPGAIIACAPIPQDTTAAGGSMNMQPSDSGMMRDSTTKDTAGY